MMKHEFEELAGYEVSYEDYTTKIEPMYMAMPGSVSKQDFVKMIDKKAFAIPTAQELIREMKKIARHLKETCNHYTDYEAIDKLYELGKKVADRCGYHGGKEDYVLIELEYNPYGCSYPKKLLFGGLNRSEQVYELVK